MAPSRPRLVSMELDDEDKYDASAPMIMPDGPDFPYGLCITLTEKELEKLDLSDDCEVGDMIDMRCFARIKSISKNDGPNGPSCCISLQIEHMACENEMLDEDIG